MVNLISSISVFMRWHVVVAAILLVSCGQGAEHKEGNEASVPNQSASYDNTLSTGVVKDTVVCKNDEAQSYALYLPKDYTSKNAWPCIILFDAHARGALPLRMYKDIAEKYGFILVGSNISKNGTAPELTSRIVNTLWEDIHKRLNIDAGRTYTSGFSGGSKVASLFAMTHSGITGVIGCAGGFPNTEQEPQHTFEYFGIAGDYDFNLPEMMQLDDYLEQKKQPHFFLTWSGIHSWPPAKEFQTGVLWMVANSMKNHRLNRNDTVVADLTLDLNRRISNAASNNDQIITAKLLSSSASILEGLGDVNGYKRQLLSIVSGNTYSYSLQTFQQLIQEEQKQSQEMGAQFNSQNEEWWKNKIDALNQQASHSKKIQEANSTRRVLAFLGFISYLNVSRAISTGDMVHAASYLKIFKMADPKNPDCSYFAAIVSMKNKDTKAAMTALNEAVTLGYSDVEQLINEPAFGSLSNNAAFSKVVDLVRDNHDGKTLVH